MPRRPRRFTQREWDAINYALACVLAGEALDGYEGEEDEDEMWAALRTAHDKVEDRIR